MKSVPDPLIRVGICKQITLADEIVPSALTLAFEGGLIHFCVILLLPRHFSKDFLMD